MSILKPEYYDKFQCAADKCIYTCCREWDIDVDAATQKRWQQVGIKTKKYIHPSGSGSCISLNNDKKCPLLTEKGLCSLVLKYGEGIISKTCHTYPREKHEFAAEENTVKTARSEYNLEMGCPEALRLLWNEDHFNVVSESDENPDAAGSHDMKMRCIRRNICELVQNKKFTIEEALKMAFFILLDLKNNEEGLTSDYINDQFKEEILSRLAAAVRDVKADCCKGISEQNELFLDLADSYRQKNMYSAVIEPLAAAAEAYEDAAEEDRFAEKRKLFEPHWEKMSEKMRLLFAEEIYSSLYTPGGDIGRMILKMQWMGILFASLKQCLFLSWTRTGADSEDDIKRITAILIRMSGYSEEDISTYLKNSFESEVWDWAYMNLICS